MPHIIKNDSGLIFINSRGSIGSDQELKEYIGRHKERMTRAKNRKNRKKRK